MLLWVVIVYTGLAYLTSMLLLFTICLPLSKNWLVTCPPISVQFDSTDFRPRAVEDRVVGTENVMCSASSPAIVFQVGWALHFFGDILGTLY